MNKVKFELTDKRAIYMDDSRRITNRSTKWGIHNNVAVFFCYPENLFKNLRRKGYEKFIELIDDEEILEAQK